MSEGIRCIDLFCGVGGLTHGLTKGGVEVVAGIDIDPTCRFPYEANNDAVFIERNIRDVSSRELESLFGEAKVRLLAGCAPCQPFSSYSQKGRQIRKDNKWDLVSDFGRLVKETQPHLITMENVPQLLDHEVFKSFVESLEGYKVWWSIVDCAWYGVPQARRRLVLLASRLGTIKLAAPDTFEWNVKTVRDAISHLKPLDAGCSDPNDALHICSSLSALNLQRIRASKPGGTWRDWEESLVAACHRKTSGATYPSVYGRMEWDAPAPTITTQCFGFGNGRFGHPEQDRALSLREAAILQTFPDNYRFLDKGEKARFHILGRLIGNAVPVRLGEVIAHSLRQHLQEYSC